MTSAETLTAGRAVEDPISANDATKRKAVVDIGSNSVRLVVYEGPARAPIPICNEKALCGLGAALIPSPPLTLWRRCAGIGGF